MGVPKFFRWLSERFPKINQRATFEPEQETYERYFGTDNPVPTPLDPPDPVSTCGLSPEIDRLYIDCNGVLHGCSHNNGDATGVTKEDIFRNVAYYLDRAISDMVKPKELVYIAIDGVAPRAKLNQQRARRFRGGPEEMEQSIYEEFYDSEDSEKEEANKVGDRLTGKFESSDEEAEVEEDKFHSNAITPGTEFFAECTEHLEHWIQYKISTDPKWQNLKVIFSGPNVPGEGEHKMMEFIRQERAKPDYNPNLRHAIMGQDGDLVMLGLATHEPNLCIFRERVIFDAQKRALYSDLGLDVYLHNCHFEWLHMSVLRDYLMFEFETAPAVATSQFDRERTIDDFVFLTFFVGNDFLPHMPALDIGDEAFDLIFHIYKKERRNKWARDKNRSPYLTDSGNIVSGRRLEKFLQALGSHEFDYYDNKRQSATENRERMRQMDAKMGYGSTIPSDEVLSSKEESDRARYREMMESIDPLEVDNLSPVLTDAALPTTTFQPEDEDLEDGFMSRMGNILQSSISKEDEKEKTSMSFGLVDDQDMKGRYYYDKFQFSPFDATKHRALRKAYIEGLVWNLKYYYEGCVSWSWYYPYHYGPMLSDLVGIDEILYEVDFGKHNCGEPLKPFEQLMGCMPPSSSSLLPEPHRWLMTDPNSPISEFYPRSFIVDMNGKRWPWEAVVLLPFLDSARLIQAAGEHVKDNMLTDAEKDRNELKEAVVYYHDASKETMIPALPIAVGEDDYFGALKSTAVVEVLKLPETPTVFKAKLLNGVSTPSPGFPSLTSAPIQSLWRRRMGTNVFGTRSRYRTALLNTSDQLPALPPIEVLATKLIGTIVHINYPHFMEAFVTSLSNATLSIRGKEEPVYHSESDTDVWRHTMTAINNDVEFGEGIPGSGGWKVPNSSVAISVRPFKEIRTFPDGSQGKTYAKFEITLPLMAAIWSPLTGDPRTENLMAALEKDPFFTEQFNKGLNLNGSSKAALLPSAEETPSSNILSSNVTAEATLSSFGDAELTSSSILPKIDAPSASSKSGSILPPADGKRGYSTASPLVRFNHYADHPARRSLSTATRRNITTARSVHGGSSARGRALGLGVAALVFFGGAIGGTQASPNNLLDHGMMLGSQMDVEASTVPPLEFAHGTTTLSFVFQGGIVAAVDSRASLGNFVGSKTVQKVLPINSHILGTMAGGAADCSYWIRKIKAEAELFELSKGYRMTVGRASKLLSNALYGNRGADLSVGTMVMGFDQGGGPRIFYVDNTGLRIEGDMFSVGSGSTFALGILDNERNFDMTQDEAVALGIKAIRHATFRDAFSGGFINVFLITKSGWKKVFSEDLASTAANMEMEKRIEGK